MTKKIKMKLQSNQYEIAIGKNIFKSSLEIFRQLSLPGNYFVVVNNSVWRFYGSEIQKLFSSVEGKVEYFILASSEQRKNLRTVEKIYQSLIENKFSRDTTMVALGGGNIGDVAGFAAATFMRGIPVVQIPTTLLAAVDSAIGGKTGVNFKNSKNTIGAFYHPWSVIIDTNFFSTLPKKEIVSGLAEVIKYAYLSEEKFFNHLENELSSHSNFENYDFASLVEKSVLVKASVVLQDEKETSLRKILNFGHTFGHAFESALKFKITHGDAVRIGMISSLLLSRKVNLISDELLGKTLPILSSFPFPAAAKRMKYDPDISFREVYSFMLKDKKNAGGKIRFVLFKDFGKMILDFEAEKNLIKNIFNETITHIQN